MDDLLFFNQGQIVFKDLQMRSFYFLAFQWFREPVAVGDFGVPTISFCLSRARQFSQRPGRSWDVLSRLGLGKGNQFFFCLRFLSITQTGGKDFFVAYPQTGCI